MKTITAREFQRNHASIVKEVAHGREYEVTFHRKPLIKLVPIRKNASATTAPGSRMSLVNSLHYTLPSTGDLHNLSYKQLRNRLLHTKYDK